MLTKKEVIDGIVYYESEATIEPRDFAVMIALSSTNATLDYVASMIMDMMKSKKEWSKPLSAIGLKIVEEQKTLMEESDKEEKKLMKKLNLSEEESKGIIGLSVNANSQKLTIMKREEA